MFQDHYPPHMVGLQATEKMTDVQELNDVLIAMMATWQPRSRSRAGALGRATLSRDTHKAVLPEAWYDGR